MQRCVPYLSGNIIWANNYIVRNAALVSPIYRRFKMREIPASSLRATDLNDARSFILQIMSPAIRYIVDDFMTRFPRGRYTGGYKDAQRFYAACYSIKKALSNKRAALMPHVTALTEMERNALDKFSIEYQMMEAQSLCDAATWQRLVDARLVVTSGDPYRFNEPRYAVLTDLGVVAKLTLADMRHMMSRAKTQPDIVAMERSLNSIASIDLETVSKETSAQLLARAVTLARQSINA